jgi:hypothetical protein
MQRSIAAVAVAVSAVAALCGSKGTTFRRKALVYYKAAVPEREATSNNNPGLQRKQQRRVD